MVKNNKKNELKKEVNEATSTSVVARDTHERHEHCEAGNVVNTTRNAKYVAGHTEGNIFTGEQISVERVYELDRGVSADDLKSW
jgi:hypothetical protein